MILWYKIVQFFTRPPMRRDGYMLFASFMFAAGLSFYLTTNMVLTWPLGLAGCVAAMTAWHFKHHIKAICLLLVLAGYYYAHLYGMLWGASFLAHEGVLFEVAFTVDSISTVRGGGARLLVTLDKGRAGLQAGSKLQVETDADDFPRQSDRGNSAEPIKPTDWRIGAHYSANLLVFRPEERFLEPDGHERLQAYYAGISGYGILLGGASHNDAGRNDGSASKAYGGSVGSDNSSHNSMGLYGRVHAWLLNTQARLREHVRSSASAYFSEDVSGIVRALMLGEVTAIAAPIYETFRAAGLAHLFAVSGLHIGIVVGGVLVSVQWGLRWIYPTRQRVPLKHFAVIAALLAGGFYLFLSGGSVSGVRAYIFSVFALFAYAADRRVFTFRTLGFAVFIILLLSPTAFLTPGFQLSFVVTGALLLVYEVAVRVGVPHRYLRGQKGRGVSGKIKAAAVTAGTAQLAAAPITLAQFQTVSLIGFSANIIIVPFVAAILLPLMLTVFLLILLAASAPAAAAQTLGPLIAWPLNQLLSLFLWSAEALGTLSYAQWHMGGRASAYAPMVMLPFLAAFLYMPKGGEYNAKQKQVGTFIACALCAVTLPVANSLLHQREGSELLIWGRLPQAALVRDDGLLLYGVRKNSQREYALTAYAGEADNKRAKRLGGACSQGLCTFDLTIKDENLRITYIKSAKHMRQACSTSDVIIAGVKLSHADLDTNTQHYNEFSDDYLSHENAANACRELYHLAQSNRNRPQISVLSGAGKPAGLNVKKQQALPVYLTRHDLESYGGVKFSLKHYNGSHWYKAKTEMEHKTVLSYEPLTPKSEAVRPWHTQERAK